MKNKKFIVTTIIITIMLTSVTFLFADIWTLYNKSTTNNGLQANSIRDMEIESNGTLWVATNGGGISQFDGTTWTFYKTGEGLANNYAWDIAFDSAHNKWIATGNGLSKFDDINFTNYDNGNSGLSTNNCRSVAVDQNDDIWIGTYGGGLFKFDGSNWTNYNTSNSDLPHNRVWDIDVAADNSLWLATFGGVAHFDGTNWDIYADVLLSDDVYALDIASNGDVWVASIKGINKFDGISWYGWDEADGLSKQSLRAIAVGPDGIVWVGTYGSGADSFDGTNFTNYNSSNSGIAYNNVWAVYPETEEEIWFGCGSSGGGVCLLDLGSEVPDEWITYDKASTGGGINNNAIRAITHEDGGILWIGTNGGGMSKFDGVNWTLYKTTEGLINNYVWGIAIDSQGNKWISTNGGVSKYDGTNFTNYTKNEGMSSNAGRGIAIDNNGTTIWVGTNGGGLNKFDGSTWTCYNKGNSNIPSNYVKDVAVDSQGNVWCATLVGAVKFDGTNWTNWTSELPNDGVWGVNIDADDNKWFATIQGLAKYNGSSWTVYEEENGMAEENARDMCVDADGILWAATVNVGGAHEFDGTTWTQYKTTNSDIANNYVWVVYAETPSKIWFGSNGGISLFLKSSEEPELPVADFTVIPRQGWDKYCAPEYVSLSTGRITDYYWEFGDGSFSTEMAPNHKYEMTGIYTVKLTVSGPDGPVTKIKTNYITINDFTSDYNYPDYVLSAATQAEFDAALDAIEASQTPGLAPGDPTWCGPNSCQYVQHGGGGRILFGFSDATIDIDWSLRPDGQRDFFGDNLIIDGEDKNVSFRWSSTAACDLVESRIAFRIHGNDNVVRNITFDRFPNGLHMRGGQRNLLENITVNIVCKDANTFNGDGNHCIDCVARGCTYGSSDDITVMVSHGGSQFSAVINNMYSMNGFQPIRMAGGGFLVVRNSNFLGEGSQGPRFGGESNIIIFENNYSTSRNGIRVSDKANVLIRNNTMDACQDYGIYAFSNGYIIRAEGNSITSCGMGSVLAENKGYVDLGGGTLDVFRDAEPWLPAAEYPTTEPIASPGRNTFHRTGVDVTNNTYEVVPGDLTMSAENNFWDNSSVGGVLAEDVSGDVDVDPLGVPLSKAIIPDGTYEIQLADEKVVPENYSLTAFPNPFNPETNVIFMLPQKSKLSIEVYDILGRRVKVLTSGIRETGQYQVKWNGTNTIGLSVSSGVYFIQFRAHDLENAAQITLMEKVLFLK
jgi:ligand-binding sensor domain-containing protein